MDSPLLGLVVAGLLVLANAFFVASEFAIVKMRPTRLEQLAAQGNRRAQVALQISRRLDEYLSANQLGITLASLALGWVGESAFSALLAPVVGESTGTHAVSAALSFGIITFLHTVAGELAPKSLAIQRTETTALWTAVPLRAFYLILLPFIWVLNSSSTLLLRMVGLRRVREVDTLHSAQELRLVMQHVAIDPGARKVIDRVFDYAHRVARHVMTLPADVVALEVGKTFEENLEIALKSQYSRFPMLDEKKERVLGYVHLKDLFAAVVKGERPSLRQLLREPLRYRDDAPLEDIRREMQRRGILLAVIENRDGTFAGIVTLEDLIEEVIGEIRDEQDAGEVPPLVKLPDGGFEADGRLTLDVLQREIGLELELLQGVETIGGHVMTRLAGMPRVGDTIEEAGYRVTVTAVAGRRVARVKGEKIAK